MVFSAASITSANDLAATHESTTVVDNLDRLLRYLGKKSVRPGKKLSLDASLDFPVIDVEDAAQFRAHLDWLRDDDLIDIRKVSGLFVVTVTRLGWERLQTSTQPGGKPGVCFIAMWFDQSMTEAYELGIALAVEKDCGFTAVRIDRKEHNNQITDEIMAGIRGAQFMVADFTGHRAGVYYEAGFARGLGRDVIYCCRDDEFKERHFDTSVINHIVWTDPADLRQKLTNRIRSTVLPKA